MHYISSPLKKTPLILLFSAVLLLLNGCITTSKTRGYNLERLNKSEEKIVPGETTQADIRRILGSASTVSTFGNTTWYYIATKTEAIAFLTPKVIEHKVLAVTFDDANLVSAVNEYDRNDMAKIAINTDTTPTEGHNITVIQQLLGNVGRFNSDSERLPGGGPNGL